jgi:hypothetical protein
MTNNLIDDTQKEASKIYDAFITAIALPGLFKKETTQLVINTLKFYLQRDYSNDAEDAAEKEIISQYVKYLENLK